MAHDNGRDDAIVDQAGGTASPRTNEPERDARTDPQGDPEPVESFAFTAEEAQEEKYESHPAEQELEETREKLLRALAEQENMRRRFERDLDDARKYAATGFARDILDVADNLRRALETMPEDAKEGSDDFVKNLLTGVEMTERSLLNAFEKHKVVRIEPELGEKFDHKLHQAMFELPTTDMAPGHVAQVMQHGYRIADRLLRPALVGVSKAPPQQG